MVTRRTEGTIELAGMITTGPILDDALEIQRSWMLDVDGAIRDANPPVMMTGLATGEMLILRAGDADTDTTGVTLLTGEVGLAERLSIDAKMEGPACCHEGLEG